MKTIEELQKEYSAKQNELSRLYGEIADLQENAEILQDQIQYIKEQITNYEQYIKDAQAKERYSAVLMWLSGQSETNQDIGDYNGIVSVRLDLCHFIGKAQPKGSKAEIFEIMKQYNCSQIEVSTNFVPCWSWGNYIISIKIT